MGIFSCKNFPLANCSGSRGFISNSNSTQSSALRLVLNDELLSGMSFSDVFLSLALFHDLITIVIIAYSVLTLYDLESDYVNARSVRQ